MPTTDEALKGAVRPTLFLGLGGTGKEVLLRLRRKFYERLGGVVGLPCTSYLWVDTDARDVLAFGEKMDEVFAAVAFKSHESVSLLTGSVKDDLADVLQNRNSWRHIHNWLPDEVGRYGAEIADGAGGVRAVGRLTYSNHFTQFNPLLIEAIENVRSHDRINKTREFFTGRGQAAPDILNAATQVVLVCSLAGGTGCGTFLDAAFHLRHLAVEQQLPIERILGMFFLPNVFYSNSSDETALRSYGNAYAALKELEYYTFRLNKEGDLAVDFDVEWERDKPRSIAGPPFSIAYLMEMKNEGGTPLEPRHRAEVFDVVAESLYLDFIPGAFSTAKRSHYSNVAGSLASASGTNISFENVSLPQAFARRYASCGMSKIEIPVDRVKAACVARLAYDIASYINRDSKDERITDNVRNDMSRLGLDAPGLLRQFGIDWKEKIRSALGTVIPRGGVTSTEKVNELDTQIHAKEQELINADSDDPIRWGSAIGIIRNRTATVTQAVEKILDQWVKDTLENDLRGLKLLVSVRQKGGSGQAETQDGYLRYLQEYIKDLYAPSDPAAKPVLTQLREKANADAKAWRDRRDQALKELREAVRSIGLKALGRADWTLETLLARFRTAEEQYCVCRSDAVALECVHHVAEAAVASLGDRRAPLEAVSAGVAKIAQEFLSISDSALAFNESVLHIRFFDRAKDWPRFYRLDTNEQGQALAVDSRGEYKRFLNQQLTPPGGGEATLWSLVELHSRAGGNSVRAKLKAYSETRMWTDFDAHPRQVDLLTHPLLTQNLDTAVERLVSSARPMARRETKLGGQAVGVRRTAYLGVPRPANESPADAEFVERVSNLLRSGDVGLADTDINVHPTGKPYEVYLYMVTYAFPLPALKIVTSQCHEAYRDFYRNLANNSISTEKYQIPLHLSKQWEGKFDDLKVYTEVEAQRIKEAREILLFGSILRVMDLSESQGRLVYGYTTGAPFFQPKPCGARREASDYLQDQANAGLRAEFLQTLKGREQLLGPSLETYYWILTYLMFCGMIPELSTEGALLKQRIEQLYPRLLESGIPAASLNTSDAPDRLALLRTKIEGSVDWVGGIPILKSDNVTAWSSRASA